MLGIVQGGKAALALGAGVAGISAITPIYHSAMSQVQVIRDMNQASQIQDAIVMAQAEGMTGNLSLRMLKAGGYIAKIPKGWDASSPTPFKVLSDANICSVIDSKFQTGFPAGQCPSCDQAAAELPACMLDQSPVLKPS